MQNTGNVWFLQRQMMMEASSVLVALGRLLHQTSLERDENEQCVLIEIDIEGFVRIDKTVRHRPSVCGG